MLFNLIIGTLGALYFAPIMCQFKADSMNAVPTDTPDLIRKLHDAVPTKQFRNIRLLRYKYRVA